MSELGAAQAARTREEIQRALRALLARPLLTADGDTAEDFVLVRRHATVLERFFAEQVGWSLRVEREMARLRKLPSSLTDASRPARARAKDPAFSRRRYALLCLALATLERSDRQITLRRVAEAVAAMVAEDPRLRAAGVEFELSGRDQRQDIVAVVRWLIAHRVLRRVEGEEQAFVGDRGDVLYQVNRQVLAWVLGCANPPSAVDGPARSGSTSDDDFDVRLARLGDEPHFDSDESRKRALRHGLARRLLDDPVVYYDELTAEQLDYLQRSRAAILRGLAEHSGLIPEVRKEGLALTDRRGDATDVALPEEGTDGHLTLLLAEFLTERARAAPDRAVPLTDIHAHVYELAQVHKRRWRKAASEPGAEIELSEIALAHLVGLGLVRRSEAGVTPRPAIGRFALAGAS